MSVGLVVNPLMCGSEARRRTAAKSAPSAKSLIRRSVILVIIDVVIGCYWRLESPLQLPRGRATHTRSRQGYTTETLPLSLRAQWRQPTQTDEQQEHYRGVPKPVSRSQRH